MKRTLLSVSVATLLASVSSVSVASTVTIPNSFTAGDKAVAAEVNANFNAVKAAVDDNAAKIGTNTTNITTNTTNINTNTTDIATLKSAGSGCPSDMVAVGPVCIDKFENSVWDAPTGGNLLGNTTTGVSGADGQSYFPCARNGSDCAATATPATAPSAPIYARSVVGVLPAINISWFQAAQACANVGKRLPTTAEWQMAASGTPTGTITTSGCNISDTPADNTASRANTGASTGCTSAVGAEDMAGNVMEWAADVSLASSGFRDMTTNALVDKSFVWALGNGYKNTGGPASVYNAFGLTDGPIATNDQVGFRCAK